MGVAQEIDKLEKEFAEAIKTAEGQKKSVLSALAPLKEGQKTFGANVKAVVDQLANAGAYAKSVETGYDDYIASLKQCAKEVPGWKKKNAEAEAFYKHLLQEKKEKDAARKKAGKDYKPSKEDQIFDAVFKKTAATYEESKISDYIENQVKSVDAATTGHRSMAEHAAGELSKAIENFDSMMEDFKTFKLDLKFRKPNGDIGASVLSKEFDAYFARFKG